MSVTGNRSKSAADYLETAAALARKFAEDAVERDKLGGTPKAQRDWIRESGLLKLTLPEEYGGDGQPWSLALRIVREFAKTDSAVAHLYGYHLAVLANFNRVGTPEQKKYFLTRTAERNWFWGNTANARGESKLLGKRRDDGGYVLTGTKKFTTGTPDSDRVLVYFQDESTLRTRLGVAPRDREGLTVHDDWNGFGQRQTGSGTVTFRDVELAPDEVLEEREGYGNGYNPPLTQSVLTGIYLGIGLGALEAARSYIHGHALPYALSGVESASKDPYILRSYGELWASLKAAESLVDLASEQLDRVAAAGYRVSDEERAETAALVTAANVQAGKASLEAANRIFELTGTRSATTDRGLDRFWRNVRIHTLHNPADYKLRNIGDWALNGTPPPTPVAGVHT